MRANRTMTEEQAIALVRTHATAIAAVVGVDARQTETLMSPGACQNSAGETAPDGSFFVQGNWQMPLPSYSHATTLLRLHSDWVDEGYAIKKFQMFSENEGVIIAENPVDEVEVWIESGVPPIALALTILTPCYHPV
jgi:hypothetical protein